MSVYFIAAKDMGLVKIGTSADALNRFANMQTGSPATLEIIAVIDGDQTVERDWHTEYSDLRHRGEWFYLTGALADAINELPPFTHRLPKGKSPTRQIAEASGLSQSYASMIANDQRRPPLGLAIHLYRTIGWRHERLRDLTDAELDIVARVAPWPEDA